MEFITHSPEETEMIGKAVAQHLRPGDSIALSGDLGAGKTVFARGILRGLGYAGRVTSPTFTIVNEYETPAGLVAHLDLYRILQPEALWEIGLEEYLNGSRIVLIEWSENAGSLLPETIKHAVISYSAADDTRVIQLKGDWKIENIGV